MRVSARGILETGEWVLGHLAAIVLGFVMMILGLAMGVNLVMLPAGLVIGLVGVLVFVWGLFGHLQGPKDGTG